MSAVARGQPATDAARLRGVLLLLASGLVASCGGPLFRAIEQASAWQVLFYRALGMLLVVGLYAWARAGWRFGAAFGGLGWRGLGAALCLTCAFVCYITALSLTTVANTMFMVAAGPLVGALLGRLFLGDRVRPVTWLAMAIAAAGVAVMVGDSLASGQFWGNLAGFGAGGWFACFAVILRGAALNGHRIDANAALSAGGLIGMAVCAVITTADGSGLLLSAADTGYALALGAVQLGLALIFFTIGARYLQAAEAMLLALLEVVLSPFWTWLIFAERPSDLGLLGGLVLLGAMVLQGAWGLRPRRAAVPEMLP
jgi:drug/metabolite transporter (DMT)-like permease